MPWRLIIMIIVVAIFLVFITFNLENKCDINFFGAVIHEAPVFVTIFISFVIGLLGSIPLVFLILRKYKKKQQETDETPIEPELPADYPVKIPADENIKKDAAEAKKRFLSNRRPKE